MKNLDSINKEQRLFVLKCGKGFSCLGFDVVLRKIKNLSTELNVKVKNHRGGSKASLKTYYKLLDIASKKHKATNWRSKSELIPQFIGHEGKRVEVVWTYGEKSRFIIGKSTGFIPCHLEIKQRNSTGGSAVYGDLIKNFRFI